MKYKRLMAIDPGGTIGIAVRAKTGDWFTCTASEPNQLYDMIKPNIFDAIVIENFVAETISKYGLHTVRIVGGMQALCHYLNIPLTIHTPQMRYPFKTEAKGLLSNQRYVVHEMDALSHLLRWEFDNNIPENVEIKDERK